MAITKTGVTLESGGASVSYERSGSQSSVTADGLKPNTSYTVQAYVVEDNGRTTYSESSSSFTTLQAGDILLDNRSSWDGKDVALLYDFRATYPIDGVKVLNDDTKDFANPVTYTPAVSGTYSGSFSVAVLDPKEYVLVLAYDIYGEEVKDIFDVKDLP